jgi:predicted DNA-binding mobile mystery protein A
VSFKPAAAHEPKNGWIRLMREALGLSLADVAKRVGIHRQNVLSFQKSEETEHITIRNLRRIAEAMDCELVYYIIPRRKAIVDLARTYAEARGTGVIKKGKSIKTESAES